MPNRPSTLTEPPLLRTKISVPQIPSGSVSRPRLTEQIHRGTERPLVLLAAPAGFGKTHLLLEWAKETRLPVAWLTLDDDDNDLSRFFRYLVGSLQTLEAKLAEEALDFTLSSAAGVEHPINQILDAILPRPPAGQAPTARAVVSTERTNAYPSIPNAAVMKELGKRVANVRTGYVEISTSPKAVPANTPQPQRTDLEQQVVGMPVPFIEVSFSAK